MAKVAKTHTPSIQELAEQWAAVNVRYDAAEKQAEDARVAKQTAQAELQAIAKQFEGRGLTDERRKMLLPLADGSFLLIQRTFDKYGEDSEIEIERVVPE